MPHIPRPKYLLIVFAIALAILGTYWPIATLSQSMKWDITDGYLPLRYFLSECLQNGELPLWQPYTSCGYPFHADPQSAAWYWPAWLFSSTLGYTMTAIEIEFILTVFAAAWGTFLLVKTLGTHPAIAVLVAIAYCCSGFFVGNAQHLTWTISGACVPWIFYSYHQIRKKETYGYSLLTALFLNLLLTGGYPAFFIVTGYGLFFLFLWDVFVDLRGRRIQTFRLKNQLLLVLVFLLLSLPFLLSVIGNLSLVNRGEGLSLEDAQFGALTLPCLLSLLFPFSTLVDTVFFEVDPGMRNAYMGLLPLLAGSLFFILPKRKTEALLLGLSLFFLTLSLGRITPLHSLFYHFLPGFNLFRFPALFRLFFILTALLFSAMIVQRFFTMAPGAISKKKLLIIFCIPLFILFVIFLFSLFKNSGALQLPLFFQDVEAFLKQSTKYRQIIVQGIVQLLFLAGLIFVLRKRMYYLLLLMVIADMALAGWMNRYTTVYAFPTKAVDRKFADFPKGFPLPGDALVGLSTDYGRNYLWPISKNTGFYYKTVQHDGYNSFRLKAYETFKNRVWKDSALMHPLAYLTGGIALLADSVYPADKQVVYLNRANYIQLKPKGLSHQADDKLNYLHFSPNKQIISVQSRSPQLLVILQNDHPDWQFSLDGKRIEHLNVNTTFMGCLIPAGKHQIQLEYRPQAVIFSFWVSSIALLLLLSGLLLYRNRLF